MKLEESNKCQRPVIVSVTMLGIVMNTLAEHVCTVLEMLEWIKALSGLFLLGCWEERTWDLELMSVLYWYKNYYNRECIEEKIFKKWKFGWQIKERNVCNKSKLYKLYTSKIIYQFYLPWHRSQRSQQLWCQFSGFPAGHSIILG